MYFLPQYHEDLPLNLKYLCAENRENRSDFNNNNPKEILDQWAIPTLGEHFYLN